MKIGYKKTDIGIIPADWEINSLSAISKIIMGQSPLSKFYNSNNNGLPLIQGNADILNRKTIIRNYTSSITKIGKQNDIIMSVRAPVGVIAKATFDCCLGRGVCAIRGNKYLYYYLIFIEEMWDKFSTGSTFGCVNSHQINNIFIPIPKPAEQTAIANILSDADKLIENIERLIIKKQAIKKGAMQQLLTGKKRLSGFKEKINMSIIPKGWEVKQVNDFGLVITGSTPSTKNQKYWNGNIPWVTPTDITSNKNIWKTEREITNLGLSVIRKLPKDSILITCIASIGKNVILKKEGACNQQISAIIPNKKHDFNFIYYLFENTKAYLLSKAGITATNIISKQEFSKIIFLIPKKEEQTAIANIISEIDSEIETLKNKLNKYRQIKIGIMQELLTGKKRVV